MDQYCKFCNNRCFTFFPEGTPDYILEAYTPGVSIIATCAGGQKFEKERTGYCYDDIMKEINELPIKYGAPVMVFTNEGITHEDR